MRVNTSSGPAVPISRPRSETPGAQSSAFAITGVKGHPDRFGDTFSVQLLESGEDLCTVQLLLGHTRFRTTETMGEIHAADVDTATAKLDFVGRKEKEASYKRVG